MTHEQKPESAEFRTRGVHRQHVAQEWQCEGMSKSLADEWADRELSEAEARGAAEQRRRDEEKSELISANLDKPGLIEWSVHILGPDDVHLCGSRAEAEALAEETNILAGSTNKGRSDDEFVTYAAYVVPRFKADQQAEQRRKDAEPVKEQCDNKEMRTVRAARDAARRTREEQIRELIISFEEYEHTPVSVPGYAHKMILEAEIRAVAAERERCIEVVRKHGISPFPIDDPHPNAEEINATLQNITTAIREGGEHG